MITAFDTDNTLDTQLLIDAFSNNLRFEYSVGANIIILSLIDESIDHDILISDYIQSIYIEYSYNGNNYHIEKPISFHMNSVLVFIDNLPEETPISITPYIIYREREYEIKLQLTDIIEETTLPYGNIEYNLISSSSPSNDLIVENKIKEVLQYVNGLGTYIDESYNDSYITYAKTIPIKYNSTTQTASAYYYKDYALSQYGLVQTSGGSYADNSTFFHELRHRYGITSAYRSHLTRDKLEGRSDMFSYIEDKFNIIHDAIKFETGRSDAKVWVFSAHSNIPEGNYTNDGVMNYLAANYLKALAWYTCHNIEDEDTSKVRIIANIHIENISIKYPENTETETDIETDTETETETYIDIETETDIETDTETETDIEEDIDNGENRLYLSTLIKPFIIDNGNKVFLLSNLYSNGYINKSLNLTLYPYEGISNNLYIKDEINPTTTFISDNVDFRLQSRLGFDNNIISILNTFEFPGKINKDDNYYNIDIHGDYNEIEFKDKYTNQISKFYNSFFINENIQDELDQEDFRDEINVENIHTTGFVIQIATDFNFNDIVFESIINTDNQNDNFIYDFSFSLDNIVNDWKQLNDILVIRSKFIDKRLNICIVGNNVVLTKEWFKYLINDTNIGHIIFDKQNNLINTDFMNINKGFNLINNLNCVIVDKKESNNIKSTVNNTSTQIIYKPVFYKVQDLQNLRIRQGVTQNIGINLGDFMTKVDLFILNIDGNNIKESSRNDINVIFNINANIIENNNGIYNILDQNFDYISSGNYMLY